MSLFHPAPMFRVKVHIRSRRQFKTAPAALTSAASCASRSRGSIVYTESFFPREEARQIAARMADKGFDAEVVPAGDPAFREERPSLPRCPRCGSSMLRLTRRGGFDWGKAAFSSLLLGPGRGGSAGLTGSGSREWLCQSCGRRFPAD